MTQTDFVHLHIHTQYSLLDGAIRIDPLIQRAQEFGMSSIAMTDHGTMFGVVEFYEKMTKAGLKPIIGCECYLAPRKLTDKTSVDAKDLSHLVLLAENQEGYKNLCALASMAQLKGFYYKPRIDKEVLAAHSGGLIALSACLKGEIPKLLKRDKTDEADEAARFYLDIFGENNFFLEVQKNGLEEQEIVNARLLEMSQRLSIPLVATNDCHYLDKEDVRAHEVLLCIQTGKTIKDADRFRFNTDQLYFKSPQVMEKDFADFSGALENTAKIANRCHIEFDFKTYHFPQFDADQSADDLFDQKVREGYGRIMEKIRSRHPNLDETVYQKRLDYEMSVIKDMGFPGYFLIVADFITYAKENNIPVGPGRGSAAGSLVAYSLGITDLDPIEHGLIFERFLNPARISMPDIDVDFCINGREQVFKYVVDRYGGGDYVAQIITFGKLKSRAVIRDVGRALDIPLKEVDVIAKMVPDVLNIKLDDALKQEPRLKEMAETRDDVAELIQIARTLEGLPRHASTHAAGVVIGDRPLVEYLPLYRGKKDEVVTQLDMKRVEQIGLVKFDFLGLRNLTVIQNALRLIEESGKTPPDLSDLDMDDSETYRLLCAGDTTGVFQLESSGMKDLLTRLKPACFDDVIALVALYRPGPLDSGMVDDFVERKHGRRKVAYLIPELEPILQETYGVIVYQEQVMKIASELANYSMAEADGLRKAMGKKIVSIMAEHRDRFVKGSEENRIPTQKSTQIFDLMEKFGGYGFNKTVDEETLIYTTGGVKKIKECQPNDEVITIGKDGNCVCSKIIQLHDHGHVPIWEVVFDDGTIERCTLDHKWLTRYGQLPLWKILQMGEQVWGIPHFKTGNAHASERMSCMPEYDSDRTDCCQRANHALRCCGQNSEESKRAFSELSDMSTEIRRGAYRRRLYMDKQMWGDSADKKSHACPPERMSQMSQHDSQRTDFWKRTNYVLRCCGSNQEKSERTFSELSGLSEDTKRNSDFNLQKPATYPGNASEIFRNSQKNICPSRYSERTGGKAQDMAGSKSRGVSKDSRKGTCFSQAFKNGELVGAAPDSKGIYKKRENSLSKRKKTGGFCQSGEKDCYRNRWSLALFTCQFSGILQENSKTRSDAGTREKQTLMAINPIVYGEFQEQRRTCFDHSRSVIQNDRRRNLGWHKVYRKPVRTTFLGFRQGYDLEIDHPEHNFVLASGLCCSNSHSAAYALIAYQTAYLKAHFPVEFMASLLTSEMHTIDGVVKFIAECRSHDIPVLPPDVNKSFTAFTVDHGQIRFGLAAVKNVGEGAIEAIIKARGDQPFDSIFDFCERVDQRKVNKRVMESLIRCGAFDSTNARRAQMIAVMEDALDYGQRVQKEKSDPQMGLFDMVETAQPINPPTLPQVEEFEDHELLAMEKDSLGFYITGHPLKKYESILKGFCDTDTLSLKEKTDGAAVRLGAVVTAVKTIRTKRGDQMAFITLEDMRGTVEVTVFSSLYEQTADLLGEDQPVLVEGQIQRDENTVKLLADKIIPIDQAEETWTRQVTIQLDVTKTDQETLEKLLQIFKDHRGPSPAVLGFLNPGVSHTRIAVADDFRLAAGPPLRKAVENLLGYDAVMVACKAPELEKGQRERGHKGKRRGG